MSSNPPAPSADWRRAVPQSIRSEEISKAAEVLASLEQTTSTTPNVTPQSKLMLASKFEQKMFDEAESFEDYQKKINKKLKKLTRKTKKTIQSSTSAAPTAAMSPMSSSAAGVAANISAPVSTATVQELSHKIQALKKSLRTSYQSQLSLIVKSGQTTVLKYMKLNEKEKAQSLGCHLDKAIEWAVDIGVVPDDGTSKKSDGTVYWGRFGADTDTSDSTSATALSREERRKRQEYEYLLKIEQDMKVKDRLKNLWFYVLKSVDIPQFFLVQLQDMEDSLINASTFPYGDSVQEEIENYTRTFANGLKKAMENEQVVGANGTSVVTSASTTKAKATTTTMSTTTSKNNNAKTIDHIREKLEKIKSIIPIPKNPEEEKEACLISLSKIRDACAIILTFLTLAKENDVAVLDEKNPHLELKGCIVKAHSAAVEAFQFLEERYKKPEDKEHEEIEPDEGKRNVDEGGNERKKPNIVLEDAWNKVLKYENEDEIQNQLDQDMNDTTIMEDGLDMES